MELRGGHTRLLSHSSTLREIRRGVTMENLYPQQEAVILCGSIW